MINLRPRRYLLASCLATASALLPAQEPQTEHTPARLLESLERVPVSSDGAAPFGVFQQGSGRVHAESGRFRAEFTADAVALWTPSEEKDGEQPRLELRYLNSSRSGARAQAPMVTPKLAGDYVRYSRDALVETYEVRAGGYEQSFHIDQRPAGSGDLVIAIAVAGNVTAPAAEARHQALEFRHGEVRAIRYGEAIAFDRHGLRTEVLTRYDGQGRLELIVPASFVDGATYPIVVDPWVGPVFNPGGPSFEDIKPDVAYDLENDSYMVVWQREFSATNIGIRAQVFDGDGNPSTGLLAIEAGAGIANPAVAFSHCLTSNAFLIVWESPTGIRGQMRHSTNGGSFASAFAISSPAAGDIDRRPCVSGPGDPTMMVAWDRQPSGQSDAKLILMHDLYWAVPTIPASFTKSPERNLYTVQGGGKVERVRLGRSDVRRQVGSENWFANRAVWQRWYTTPLPGDWDVMTCSFAVRPTPSNFMFLQTATAVAGTFSQELAPDIASRASLHQSDADMQFCIAWEQQNRVVAKMYDLNGATGLTFPVHTTVNYQGDVSVGAGFCEFTIAYTELTSPSFDLYVRAARVLLDGTVAIGDRTVDFASGYLLNGARVASRPIHTANEKQTNTTLITWWGETGPTGAVNDIRARFFEPCAPAVFAYGSACPGPLGELPVIGTSGGAPIAGNNGFGFTLSGSPGNTIGVLLVGTNLTTVSIPGAPGCNLYQGLPLLLLFPTVVDPSGAGQVSVPIPCAIPTGFVLACQWAVYSPGANPFGWIVSSDLDVRWDH